MNEYQFLAQSDSLTLVAKIDHPDITISGQSVLGYGNIRLSNGGAVKIGPLYAERLDIAALLARNSIEKFALQQN